LLLSQLTEPSSDIHTQAWLGFLEGDTDREEYGGSLALPIPKKI